MHDCLKQRKVEPVSEELEKLRKLVLLPTISWRAKVVALTILLYPEVFNDQGVSKSEWLAKHNPAGLPSIRSAMKALREAGLLEIILIRTQAGRGSITGTRWELHL